MSWLDRHSTMRTPPESDWKYEHVPAYTLGENRLVRPDQLRQGESPRLHNVRIVDQQVIVDTGYVEYAQAVSGTPQCLQEFERKSAANELLLFTTSDAYRLETAVPEWQYIPTASTTLSATEPSGETALAVADESAFSATNKVGLILDDGTEHKTTVASTSPGVVNIDDAIPAGRTANSGTSLNKAIALSGSATQQADWEILPSADWFIFTNDIDPPQYYDGTTLAAVPNLPSGGNFTAKLVENFNNYLMFYNCTEGGTRFPQRARRSDIGDPTNWSTGNAGFNDLYETKGEIVDTEALGPYMIVYKEEAIHRQAFIGSEFVTFEFPVVVTGSGAMAAHCAVPMNPQGTEHLVLGKKNVYIYDGGFGLRAVDERQRSLLFGVLGEISSTYRATTFGIYYEELKEILFFYPDTGSTSPNKALRYSIIWGAWSTREFTHAMSCAGAWRITLSPPWTSLQGSWAEQQQRWIDMRAEKNTRNLLLGSSQTSRVYNYDLLAPTDAGTAIAFEVQTSDMYVPQMDLRSDRADVFAAGTDLTVEVSLNNGRTFEVLEAINPGALAIRTHVHHQRVSDVFRYRLTGSSGGFSFSWLGFKYAFESEHYD